MLPGWSGSGPQIRGPGPVTQWAWGRVCSHGLLQTANHRHTRAFQAQEPYVQKSCPGCTPQLRGRSPRCICAPCRVPPPHSLQEDARLCRGDGGWPTTRSDHLISVTFCPLLLTPSAPCCVRFLLPPTSPSSLFLWRCAQPWRPSLQSRAGCSRGWLGA